VRCVLQPGLCATLAGQGGAPGLLTCFGRAGTQYLAAGKVIKEDWNIAVFPDQAYQPLSVGDALNLTWINTHDVVVLPARALPRWSTGNYIWRH